MAKAAHGRHAAVPEKKAKTKATGSKSSEPMKARATAFLVRHPVMTSVMLTVFVFVALVALLWYTVFSGLASSADFIYSNF